MKKILIVLIAIFSIAAICFGVLWAITPEPEPIVAIDRHTDNDLIEILGIERPNREVERLLAIKTYQGEVDFEDIRKIAQVGGMEYIELDDKSDDYLLIVPLEINGKLTISSLMYDEYKEDFVVDETKPVEKCNGGEDLYNNYSLLLRYSRPDNPEYQIKLTQEQDSVKEQTATYNIINMEGDVPVGITQYVKDDISHGTTSVGAPIKIQTEEE